MSNAERSFWLTGERISKNQPNFQGQLLHRIVVICLGSLTHGKGLFDYFTITLASYQQFMSTKLH